MPRRLSTTIQHIDQINHPCKGESSLLFQPSVDTVGWRKSRLTNEQCIRWSDALLLVKWGDSRLFDWGNRGRVRGGRYGQPTWERDYHYRQEARNTPRAFGRRGMWRFMLRNEEREWLRCSGLGTEGERERELKPELSILLTSHDE